VIVYPRPYYAFRPRYWLGFGIYIGMPVPYPVMYGYPTYICGEGIVTPMPSEAPAYGGISLEITPDDASVVVDGVYVGIARDFSPTHQPLTLTAGRHHIELQAPEQAPLAFDIDVVAGEVIPYRGTLPPQ
jgi:PEGA domain-containing protein